MDCMCMTDTQQIYLQLDDALQFRLSRIRYGRFLIAKISEREKMSKTLNRYITVLNYAYKAFLVLSGAGRGASFSSFTTDISAPVGTTSARISLFFCQ